MFESKTFETLLAQKLARVPKKLDKREGSIIYDALAPNAFETAMVYAAMDVVLDETFADTASRKYLVRRCAERGITPRPATVATAKGSFNIDVPIGSRFSCDKFNWIVTERIKAGSFYMECETAGSAPSQHTGALIPIEYIDGLTYGELTEIVVHGEDAEATEDLRSRYFASFTGQTYGFNRAQYIAVTKGIPGVGGCKPYRAWSGGGTVKLVITDSDYGVPSEELIERVQSVIDPTGNHGDGIGLAPIDHVVTVAGVTKTRINVVTSVTFAEGYSLDSCFRQIKKAVTDYMSELNSAWDSQTNITVRVSQIEHRIMSIPGVVDVANTGLTTADSSAAVGQSGNIVLDKDAVAECGDISA